MLHAERSLPPRPWSPAAATIAVHIGRVAGSTRARRLAPTVLSIALAVAYLVAAPMSLDLAAAEYRAEAFARDGFSVWDLQWYGGHHMPGYSLTVPALSALIGPRLLGALSAVVATVFFERVARSRYGDRAFAGALWFAGGSVTSLISGRITFACGLAVGLAALWALDVAVRAGRRRVVLGAVGAVGLAVLTALTSPVAALFLAVAGAAAGLAQRRVLGIAVAVAALGTIGAMAVAFPEGGVEPFGARALRVCLGFTVVGLLAIPRSERTVRLGFVLYVAGVLATYVLPTPVGSNILRLGALCTGPVLALTLIGHGRARVAVLLVLLWPLATWQWSSATGDLRSVADDPTMGRGYYAPLLGALEHQRRLDPEGALGGRLEIPFTRLHWESRWVAPRFALARGWERQVDIGTNPIFYGGTVTAASYRSWLDENAVRWVALPASRLDPSAVQEARLIRGGLPYLREVWADEHWRLFAVTEPTGLVRGPARLTSTSATSIGLRAARTGTLRLRVHWTPYWAITAGDACVERDGTWTAVRVRRPGAVRLGVRFSARRIAASTPRCSATA